MSKVKCLNVKRFHMFNKLKQFKDLRDKAKKIQSSLAEEIIENSSKGVPY